MEYIALYISIVIVLVVFLILIYFKPIGLSNIIIGISSITYSLIYDITLGERLKLYYYINPENSVLYMLISGIFLYPLLNIIYTLFLPVKLKSILLYTGAWIAVMLIFEYFIWRTKTIVFTGWNPIPWSVVTYIFTYTWIFIFYRFLLSRVKN